MQEEQQSLLRIRPAGKCSEELANRFVSEAKADDHCILRASDLIMRGDQVIGYVGVSTIPMVHMWLNTKTAKVRDSKTVLEFVEATLARQGHEEFFLPIQTTSPLYKYIEKIGYGRTNYDRVFLKSLT